MKRSAVHNFEMVFRLSVVMIMFVGIFCALRTPAQEENAPVPKTDNSGRILRFDFPAMRVGVAEYDEGPTGATVFYFPKAVKAAVDIRGGAPGEINASSLMLGGSDESFMNAVVFAGGSWYGLSAATGVANGLKEEAIRRGDMEHIAGVVAAIIYDVGGRRFSRVTPDDALGKAALRSAEPNWFPMGARGAGRFAMQGVYFASGKGADAYAEWAHSGQGGAFRTIGPTKIGVFTVVNSLGAVVDRTGRIARCGRNDIRRQCPMIGDKLKDHPPIASATPAAKGGPSPNTTITLVVTNQKLPHWELQRLAVQVHSSMSRAIQPMATGSDGDILYAVTTDEVENPSLSSMDLGVIASEAAWDAVLNSLPAVPDLPGALANQPEPAYLRKFAGVYTFPGGGELSVGVAGGFLTARFRGHGLIYFDAEKDYRLIAADNGSFIIDSAARDVIRFEGSGGRITGLTINPGPWPIKALRRE